jgi:hypothetical protein
MHVLHDYDMRRTQFFEDILQAKVVKFKDHGNYDARLFFSDKVELYDRIIANQKNSVMSQD